MCCNEDDCVCFVMYIVCIYTFFIYFIFFSRWRRCGTGSRPLISCDCWYIQPTCNTLTAGWYSTCLGDRHVCSQERVQPERWADLCHLLWPVHGARDAGLHAPLLQGLHRDVLEGGPGPGVLPSMQARVPQQTLSDQLPGGRCGGEGQGYKHWGLRDKTAGELAYASYLSGGLP